MLTEQCDFLSDAVDIYDGPERAADAETAVEEDGLSVVDAVENSSMAIGPEWQHIVLQGQSLGQGFGPVSRPCHQVWASILGDVGRIQFTGVQAGETKAESSTPSSVDTSQTKAHLSKQQ